jgi:hypothetical protein
MKIDDLEEVARTETVCRGCGDEKELGLVVCWPCFKYREDVVTFKYFDGTLTEWLRTLPKSTPDAPASTEAAS